MREETGDAVAEASEPVLVGRQRLVVAHLLGVGQRDQVVGEGTVGLHGIGRDVRTDPRQQVVAGEDDAGGVVGEAEVPRGVARGPDGAEIPAGDVERGVPGQLAVDGPPVGQADETDQPLVGDLGRCAESAEFGSRLAELGLHLGIGVVAQVPGIVAMHPQLGVHVLE